MSFSSSVYAIDGDNITGQLFRLQLQSATRSATGIINSGDLKITAFGTPGAGVNSASGGCVANGGETTFQGSYFGYNVGSASVAITATGGTARSDLVVAQVKDPTFSGSPWMTTDPPWSFQVITGVAAGTMQPPAGITAVPLARIDIPASTSAITQAMITDVRQMVNPRRQRSIYTAIPATNLLTSASYTLWPLAATWQVPVPLWAGKLVATGIVSAARCFQNSPTVAGSCFGNLRWNIGGVLSHATGYDLTVYPGTNYDRFTTLFADSQAIPSGIRGTTVTANLEGLKTGGNQQLESDGFTTVSLDIEFIEDIV